MSREDEMLRVFVVAGARPNFMKVAPLIEEMSAHKGFDPVFVHTGQHYDKNMSSFFMDQLNLPEPDYHLSVGSGTHAQQTARTMERFDELLYSDRPDLVVVVGDINSTLACSLSAVKREVPVAHVEAGLRSRDRTMPEEINRIVTDVVSDLLFTHCQEANTNLMMEGIDESKIFFVGNIMADSLFRLLDTAIKLEMPSKLGLTIKDYLLVTLHRPNIVDDEEKISKVIEALLQVAQQMTVIFPVHPRTKTMLDDTGLINACNNCESLRIMEPLGYLEFLSLQQEAGAILTDSGGVQEESTLLGVPCFTFRDNTERPITILQGTNNLIGTNPESIYEIPEMINEAQLIARNNNGAPDLWDGKTSKRIVEVLIEYFSL